MHGLPTSLYADESGKLTFPSIVKTLMTEGLVTAELLYPIAVSGEMKYPFSKIHTHIQQLIDTFGSGRFMWGSDSPDVERYCTYTQFLSYFTSHFGYLSHGDLRAILRDSALQVYPMLASFEGTPVTSQVTQVPRAVGALCWASCSVALSRRRQTNPIIEPSDPNAPLFAQADLG